MSECTALVSLNCRENMLTSLDASGCLSLDTLDCSGNRLTSLNISGCIWLREISCYTNKLTGLNFGGAKLKTATSVTGKLPELELSNTHRLTVPLNLTKPDPNNDERDFERFDFPNYIDKAWFAEAKLKYWYERERDKFVPPPVAEQAGDFPFLEKLRCYENGLKSLDVSGCVMLQELHCAINQLTSLTVRGLSLLTYISCFNNPQLPDVNVSGCRSLRRIHCLAGRNTELSVIGLKQENSVLALV